MTLYAGNDALKKRLFIAEEYGIPVELICNQYFINDNQVRERNSFREQLGRLAKKYNTKTKLQMQASNINFSDFLIIRLVEKINEIKVSEKKSNKSLFFIGASLNRATTYFVGNTIFADKESTL